MQQHPTKAVREPCDFCSGSHDEMECFRNQIDEEKLFEALYEITSEYREQKEVYPSPTEIIQAYFDQDLKSREIESVMEIAEDAITDAKRDRR